MAQTWYSGAPQFTVLTHFQQFWHPVLSVMPRVRPSSPELLEALKNALRDLESVKTIDQHDPTLVELKRTILAKITEIQDSQLTPAEQ